MGLFIYIKLQWQRKEPESSQKTFLRSKLEMLKLSLLLKHSESKLRPTERLPEPLLMPMLRSTTTSIKLLIPLLSRPIKTLKLLDLSSLKENQRLLLLSELEVSESLLQSQRKSCNSSD